LTKTLNLKTTINIKDGSPVFNYKDKDWRDKLDKFKSKNMDSQVDISFEVVDSAIHGQFKYLWGELYPAIMATGEETDVYKIHLKMKTMFNYISCSHADEIPPKYLKGDKSFVNKSKLVNLDSIGYLIRFIRGTIIVSYEELQSYIKSVENYLFIDLSGSM
jgi:hypothetical protein